jgi:hypothetical protein
MKKQDAISTLQAFCREHLIDQYLEFVNCTGEKVLRYESVNSEQLIRDFENWLR